MTKHQRVVKTLAVVVLMAMLAVACGGGSDEDMGWMSLSSRSTSVLPLEMDEIPPLTPSEELVLELVLVLVARGAGLVPARASRKYPLLWPLSLLLLLLVAETDSFPCPCPCCCAS